MKAQRRTTTVYSFLERARQHYTDLGVKDDEAFLRDQLGCGKDIKKGWYERGIKPIYFKVLTYIEENQSLRKENQTLRKENQDLKQQPQSKNAQH